MRTSLQLRIVSLGVVTVALVPMACGGEGTSTAPPSASKPPASIAATSTVPASASGPLGDGCSSDNSPTAVAAAPGPAPVIPVDADSVGNQLPDLAVRRINCAGGWVNLKNEIPADRPLLVWFWAPY